MKKIISLLLILILLLSISPAQIHAKYERFPDEISEIYDVENYYDSVWHNYNFCLEESVWPYISDRSHYGYLSFADDVNNDTSLKSAIAFSSLLTKQTASKERIINLLINLMGLMDYELNDVINHQVEADTLKTFKDYARDVTGILINAATLQAKTESRFKEFTDAVDISYNFTETAISSVEHYKQLDKILLNYEMYHNLLTTIITYADDPKLVDAAETLKTSVQKALILKLDNFAKEAVNYSEFLGQDVFFDKVLMNPSNWSESDQPFITKVSAIYDKIQKNFTAAKLIVDLGVFAGDMLVGISDMLNRVNEIRTLSLIHETIVKNMEDNKKYVSRDNFDAIDQAYNNMRLLMYINARGEYCLYNLVQQDSQILSLLFQDPAETERWFQTVQSIHQNFSEQLAGVEVDGVLEGGFYPNIENYRRDTPPSSDTQGNIITLASGETEKLKELLSAADPAGTMFSFTSTDNIDDEMFFSGLISGRDKQESDFPPVDLPDSFDRLDQFLYRIENKTMQSTITGIYGREMISPQKHARYYDGYFYFDHWDLTHFNSPEYTIDEIYDLSNAYFKVLGTAICHEYATGNVLDSKSFTVIVKQDPAAVHGYFLISQKYEN